MADKIRELAIKTAEYMNDGYSENSKKLLLSALLTAAGIENKTEYEIKEYITVGELSEPLLIGHRRFDIYIPESRTIIELKVSVTGAIKNEYLAQCRHYLSIFPEARQVVLIVYKHEFGTYPSDNYGHTRPNIIIL